MGHFQRRSRKYVANNFDGYASFNPFIQLFLIIFQIITVFCMT